MSKGGNVFDMNPIFKDFRGAAVKISASDFSDIAADAGIETAALRAVVAVEASGSGFDSTGRPKVLFEPHILYRQLSGDKRDRAVEEGLAYMKWGEKPYPKGSDAQYDRINRAMEIDQSAALKSASWGLGQIMGFNHNAAGYGDVETMVLACLDSEAKHVSMMVNFIRSNNLLEWLRKKDWPRFARGYNGPGFVKNAYDVKLATAYDRFKSATS